ncbi:MAG: oligosaccharide flippase family protein [Lentisphaeria bacterium]|nr:oligosaccharide flippase family protein [Lentisphaeria bacterium]
MKLDFKKNTKRNIVANTVSRVLALLFPFLNRTMFLWILGPQYLGLNGLFSGILGVLMLAELGFGTAVICSMYKPIADDDRELVCAYLKFYRKIYRCVGAVIFIAGLCLLPFLRKLVHGNLPPGIDLHILYLLHLVNTSLSYFLFAYRGSILGAHHRNDVLTNIRTAVSVTQYLAVFLILLIKYLNPAQKYYGYVIATVCFTVIQNLLIMYQSKRLFPKIEPAGELDRERRRHVTSDVGAIFLHKLGTVISYQIDNVVISAFMGLGWVAAYGNYYYVYTTVGGLPAIIYSTMMGGFGNKLHTESKEKNFELFMRICRMVSIIIIWCTALMLALYQPFIEVWMGSKSQNLVQHFLTPALMVALFYTNQSRKVLLTFKGAAGLWREDRWKPVLGGAVKLAASLLSVHFLSAKYKLDGVICSSLIGYLLVQIPWESHVVFTNFFDRKQGKAYWHHQLKYLLLALIPCALTLAAVYGIGKLRIGGIAVDEMRTKGLILKGVAAFAVSSAVMLVIFRKELLEIMKRALRRS